MSAEKPPTGRGLVTASQCLQTFVTEMRQGADPTLIQADASPPGKDESRKTFQQAPRDDQLIRR